MGLRLPVIGYMLLRGAGTSTAYDNKPNTDAMRMVEEWINTLREARERFPNSRAIIPMHGLETRPPFCGVFIEQDVSSRVTLRAIIDSLPNGGTIVVPYEKEISQTEDASRPTMEKNIHGMIAYLVCGNYPNVRLSSEQDLDKLAASLMDRRDGIKRMLVHSP